MPEKYFFKRARSPYLQFRLVNPPKLAEVLGWRIKEVSTGTTDQDAAYVRFGEEIIQHKKLLIATRAFHSQTHGGRVYRDHIPTIAPGNEDVRDDGSVARPSDDGKHIVITHANGRIQVVENQRHDVMVLVGTDSEQRELAALEARIAKPLRDIDREIRDHWAVGRAPADVRMLDAFIELLHATCQKRSLVTLEPPDVREFVLALFNTGNSTSSVRRKFALANGMINYALGHERFKMLKTNPFAIKDLIPHHLLRIKGKRMKPVYLDDEVIKLIEDDIRNWSDDQRLLWTILRTMGARLDEPNQVTGSKIIKGYMTLEWGSKIPDSDNIATRRLPPPRAVLDLLPSRVTGSLFGPGGIYPRRSHVIMDEIMYDRLALLGIERNTGQSAQSLRHMCRTDLGNLDVHPRIVGAILGQAVDDLEYNRGAGNQESREGKSIAYRYDKGCSNPKPLFNAMNLITGCF